MERRFTVNSLFFHIKNIFFISRNQFFFLLLKIISWYKTIEFFYIKSRIIDINKSNSWYKKSIFLNIKIFNKKMEFVIK